MFVCIECGNVFNVPKKYTETHGLDCGPFEVCNACPVCGGSYTEALKCDCCENWIINDYIKTDDGKRYCENCFCNMRLGEE